MNGDKMRMASDICNACNDIAKELNNDAISRICENANQNIVHPDKLRITFVGTQIQDAIIAAEEMTGITVLPEGISVQDVRTSTDMVLTYGEEDNYAEANRLTEDSDAPVELKWIRNAPQLQAVDIEIIFSANQYADFNWRQKLQDTDFVFLVTNASFLLSAADRKFMSEDVSTYLGGARFSIIVTNGTAINSPEDYEAMTKRIVWELNALGAVHGFFECGMDQTKTFVCDELLKKEPELRELHAVQTAKICLQDTKSVLEDLLKEAQISVEQLEMMIMALKKKQNRLLHMGDIAASKAYSEVTGNMRYSCNMAIQHYADQLYDNIADTIAKTENVKHAAEMLPKFLTAAAERCMDQLESSVELELVNLEERIREDMLHDAGEFFREVEGFSAMMEADDSLNFNFHIQNDGSATQKQLNSVSKAVLVGAIPVALLGYMPVAIAAVIGSQLIKRMSREKIESENREGMLKQIHSICTTLCTELQNNLAQSLRTVGDDVEAKVKIGYRSFVDAVLLALEEKKQQVMCAQQMQEQIRIICTERIMPLEEKLA